jgi:hypothetical protein
MYGLFERGRNDIERLSLPRPSSPVLALVAEGIWKLTRRRILLMIRVSGRQAGK